MSQNSRISRLQPPAAMSHRHRAGGKHVGNTTRCPAGDPERRIVRYHAWTGRPRVGRTPITPICGARQYLIQNVRADQIGGYLRAGRRSARITECGLVRGLTPGGSPIQARPCACPFRAKAITGHLVLAWLSLATPGQLACLRSRRFWRRRRSVPPSESASPSWCCRQNLVGDTSVGLPVIDLGNRAGTRGGEPSLHPLPDGS
jgi:hypothetical protein